MSIAVPNRISHKIFSIEDFKAIALVFETEKKEDAQLRIQVEIDFEDHSSRNENNIQIFEDPIALATPIKSIRMQISKENLTKHADFFVEHGNTSYASLRVSGDEAWVHNFRQKIMKYIDHETDDQLLGKWKPHLLFASWLIFICLSVYFLGRAFTYIWPMYIPTNDPKFFDFGSYIISILVGIFGGMLLVDIFERIFPLIEICIGRKRNTIRRRRIAFIFWGVTMLSPYLFERLAFIFRY